MVQTGIVASYMILTVLIGIWSQKRVADSRKYDGMGLGVLMCVVAGAGEWLGGTSTVGVAEYGYEYGISGAWYTIANAAGVCVLAVFFAKLYRSMEVTTVSGIVGAYIGEQARVWSAALQIVVLIAIGTSQMIAAGSVGESVFHLESTESILFLGLIVLLYTVSGGMMAVAYTNIIHMLVMYGGILLAALLCYRALPEGVDSMTQVLPASYFAMSGIGYGKISSWLTASVLGACAAQAGLQPILGSKDTRTAVRSSWLIALIVAPFGILTAFLGMIAKVLYPDLENAKMALPVLLTQLPAAAGGLVMAAIIAAVLSTASPIFLSCGTLFTRDIFRLLKKDALRQEGPEELRVSRLVTLICGCLCMALAILLRSSSRALDIVYFAYSIRGSLFVILLMGIYWRNITQTGAVLAMAATGLVSFFWIFYKNQTGTYPVSAGFSETYAAVLTSVLVTLFVSLILKRKKEEDKGEKTDDRE
ncbi:MAG: sodium:solute symporter family protein [Lachnospiraceae bacterium]|nr:sodium:solute symporter family protein [Lachnospiraceae bacterium]